nr:hypothetical protein [Tanacetum cinerariifolium]
ANGCWDCWGRSWGMVWSGERGRKMKKVGFTEFGGKHCAMHSVSNVG